MADGDTRSMTNPGRSFSLYGIASRHKPLVAFAAVLGASALIALATSARRARP
jgi:hypothetical protein